MALKKLWKLEIEVEKKINNVIFKVINKNIITKIEKKKSQTIFNNILEYELL